MCKLDEGVAGDAHPGYTLQLTAMTLVDDAQAAGRLGGARGAADFRLQHPGVAGQPESLTLHRLPVDTVRTRSRVMVGYVALVQHLMPYPLREFEIRLHHCILPGDAVLFQRRVMIIVSLPDHLIINGMVDKQDAERLQPIVLGLGPGQEAHVDVSGLDVHASRPGGIQHGDGLYDILHRIWVFEFVPQHDHVVGDIISRAEGPLLRSVIKR